MMPLMLLLLFGSIQLVMVQHARLMTEYAAYNAVRAGIVWNGDQCMMRRAAVVSLLPTLGATDTLNGTTQPLGKQRPGLLRTWAQAQVLVSATGAIEGILADLGITDPSLALVDVEVLNPEPSHSTLFVNGELDFDSVAGHPGSLDFENDPVRREATVLTGRVTYLYPMRIPFVNWLVFASYITAHANMIQSGSIINAEIAADRTHGALGEGAGARAEGAKALAAGGGEYDAKGREVFGPNTIRLLWEMGLSQDVWLFPLAASHSMRMQSNFYEKSFSRAGACPPWG